MPALAVIGLAVAAATGAAASGRAEWRAKVDSSVLGSAASGKTEFLVELAPQADLSGAYSLRTKEAKGRYVYERLTATARASQAPLRAELARLGVHHQAFWIVNAISAVGDLGAVKAMASRSDVVRVHAVGRMRLERPVPSTRTADSAGRLTRATTTEAGLNNVRAPQVWALGYTGQGAVVASADTGVFFTHPALIAKYRGWNGTTANHDYNWHDGIASGGGVCPAPSSLPCDDNNHGSHTTGTMVGDDGAGNQIGMAPGAKWIACRNMDQGNGTPTTYLNCMQWLMAPTKIDGTGADPVKAPHVVNNSWSCPPSEGCPSDLLRNQLAASRAAGIFYAGSAGNNGNNTITGCGTIADPLGVYENTFTVGATSAATDAIAGFSSRGPAVDQGVSRMKPNVSAPGSSVRSSTRTGYSSLSGTSMSSPHVAGLVALIISAKPSLAGNVGAIENIIEQTAAPKTTAEPPPGVAACGGDSSTQVPNNVYGSGRIDALDAVQMALGPTAVTVGSFGATRTRAGVTVRWQTAFEAGNVGFDLRRDATKVNRSLIPAKARVAGASYRYVDRSARPGRAYVYRLQAVGLDGARRIVGTVRVR